MPVPLSPALLFISGLAGGRGAPHLPLSLLITSQRDRELEEAFLPIQWAV